jgi:hypothetical protein
MDDDEKRSENENVKHHEWHVQYHSPDIYPTPIALKGTMIEHFPYLVKRIARSML